MSAPGSSVRIREGHPSDAASVAAIYNEGIRGRSATFETTERSAADTTAWLDDRLTGRHPLLVAEAREENGIAVVGWIRASEYRSRACYAGIAEFSVYVAERARGKRVGDELMRAFVVACAKAGLAKLVSRIFPENDASRRLCARHGFREVGFYEKHATLDGVWRDVVIVERLLRENMRT